MRLIVALLLLAVTVAGAASDDHLVAAPNTVRLTTAEPIAEFHLGPIPEGSAIIMIEIGVVRNSKHLPVSVRIALTNSVIGRDLIPVSAVSLFPSDKPGSFMLRATKATEALQRVLGQPNPSIVARLTLTTAGQALQGGDLALEEIRASWVKEPRTP